MEITPLVSYACECVTEPLSKRFRKANVIFVGHQTNDYPENDQEIQNAKNGVIIMKVVQSWKGISKKYVAINIASLKCGGLCVTVYSFTEDVDYLIFAYGKKLAVTPVCSDTRLSTHFVSVGEIKRLDSGWFRFRSRIWPFYLSP